MARSCEFEPNTRSTDFAEKAPGDKEDRQSCHFYGPGAGCFRDVGNSEAHSMRQGFHRYGV